jgi:hypothetical protein
MRLATVYGGRVFSTLRCRQVKERWKARSGEKSKTRSFDSRRYASVTQDDRVFIWLRIEE